MAERELIWWFVVRSVIDDCYYARCYLCEWRGEPAECHREAEPELESHLRSEEHKRNMEPSERA